MQTASVPRSAWQVSTRSSPKKCDFPEPRPPKAALYLEGARSGSKIFAVGILRVDNDALDAVDEFERAIIAVLQGLRGLAPSAVEDRVRGRDARGVGGVLRSYHADQAIDRGPGVAACDRTDFGDGFAHPFTRGRRL